MLSATRSNLLVLGMVAMHNASNQVSDAATVSEAYNVQYEIILQEMITLFACGFLIPEKEKKALLWRIPSYALTDAGYKFLRDNRALYVKAHMRKILGECNWT